MRIRKLNKGYQCIISHQELLVCSPEITIQCFRFSHIIGFILKALFSSRFCRCCFSHNLVNCTLTVLISCSYSPLVQFTHQTQCQSQISFCLYLILIHDTSVNPQIIHSDITYTVLSQAVGTKNKMLSCCLSIHVLTD